MHINNNMNTELTKNPVDGFSAGLVDDSDIYEVYCVYKDFMYIIII